MGRPLMLADDTLVIRDWYTPVTKIPQQVVGNARIAKHPYRGGSSGRYYHLYGLHGKQFFYVPRKLSLNVTNLQLFEKGKWDTWMVDDPPHWWAMENYAEQSRGHVLCAGLGLGLIVHALATNPDVTDITVVDRNPDVIKMMTPYLPKNKPIQIANTDFWYFLDNDPRRFDAIIVDLWRGETKSPELRRAYWTEILPGFYKLRRKYGDDIPIWIHGYDSAAIQNIWQTSTATGQERQVFEAMRVST